MVTAQYLLDQAEKLDALVDPKTRFSGVNGWPPGETIPSAEMTGGALHDYVVEQIKDTNTYQFNQASHELDHVLNIAPDGPKGP